MFMFSYENDLQWYCTQPGSEISQFYAPQTQRRNIDKDFLFFFFIREKAEDLISDKKIIIIKKPFCHTHFNFRTQLIHKRKRRNVDIYFYIVDQQKAKSRPPGFFKTLLNLPRYCTQPEVKFHNFVRLKRSDENLIRIFFF